MFLFYPYTCFIIVTPYSSTFSRFKGADLRGQFNKIQVNKQKSAATQITTRGGGRESPGLPPGRSSWVPAPSHPEHTHE